MPTTLGVFGRSRELSSRSHEQVVFCEDEKSGLKAIIAIHSTALGPALGGCRMYPYADEFEALEDVLRLSWGMTYKAAAAGVNLGGGKSVIIGDPASDKSEALFAAFARYVNTLGGRYVTAGDVGTNTDDLDIMGKYTQHVTGRSTAAGGSGDSARLTALGVFNAMRAGAESVWGTASLAGRTVGVEGVGKVGGELIALLLADGAEVCATDVTDAALHRISANHPSVHLLGSVVDAPVDIYAPCALGATLTPTSAEAIEARLICGAANNQLANPGVEQLLRRRDITWVPDFVANAGGLMQVDGELRGADRATVEGDVTRIFDRCRDIISAAHDAGIGIGAAASRFAELRLDGTI
ncbi:Glu/Leu/Phe/Val dehydrogenase dimerization domain-containing protein [Mycolicibacterium sp. HK-90]|uniref:Glu/Leu/Phe/Val dehydrogenase dimerization domain-containing protein n=1 Tax=Mycolicibacterium sp. HK-90 TaxID=3056937 RepID=UPI00265A18AB|nr:Glu/Leu/Phe/Val dehydrogenase dimerization domain-containing protein [Mycolicibacterium sp. HK-90]WKG06474.1 Glu/Leu/Phe/Val dehydrogenase dimerization domain-containing protein [Mycolicibacterium sp. HK-90]